MVCRLQGTVVMMLLIFREGMKVAMVCSEDGGWSFTGSPSEQQQQGPIEVTAAAKTDQQRQQKLTRTDAEKKCCCRLKSGNRQWTGQFTRRGPEDENAEKKGRGRERSRWWWVLVGPDLVKEGRGREAHTQVEKNRTKMGRKGKMVVCFMFFFFSIKRKLRWF